MGLSKHIVYHRYTEQQNKISGNLYLLEYKLRWEFNEVETEKWEFGMLVHACH